MTRFCFAFLAATLMIAVSSPLCRAADPGVVEAIYDETTGDVTFDIGDNISLLGLAVMGNVPGSANPAAFDTSHTPAPTLGGKAADQFQGDSIAYFNFSAPLPTGLFPQGAILPPGLAQDNFGFTWQTEGMDKFADVTITGAPIPEPTSLALAGLAGLVGFLGRKRRLAA